jgi:hypothetical protein
LVDLLAELEHSLGPGVSTPPWLHQLVQRLHAT